MLNGLKGKKTKKNHQLSSHLENLSPMSEWQNSLSLAKTDNHCWAASPYGAVGGCGALLGMSGELGCRNPARVDLQH